MKTQTGKLLALALFALVSILNYPLSTAFAQGTAFTYQGRLNDGVNPATGIYDLRFGIYDAATSGNQQGNLITNSATAVSNGLFTVTLDFGNQFPGAGRWLEIGARTNGAVSFITLAPRQALTSTPYSIQSANAASAASANSVAAGNITGTLSAAQLPSSVVTNGASGVNFTGTFTGNGTGITNVGLTSLNSEGFINWQTTFLPTVISEYSPFAVVLTNIMVPTNMAVAAPPELFSVNTLSNAVDVFTNNGEAGFGLATSVPVASLPLWLAVADLNGDGKLDAVVTSLGTNYLTVLTNDGHGGLVFSASLAVQTPQFCVVAADINGDGKPDLIAANTQVSNTLSVLTNDGSGGFVLSSTPVVGNEPVQVVAADINGDGKLDLMCVNVADNTLSVLTNNGSGGFVLATNLPVGTSPEALAAADINGDGKLDLICANTGTNTLFVYTNTGSGGFVMASTNTVSTGPVSIQAVDLYGDGKVELVCGDVNDGTLLVLTNNGASAFGIASTTTVSRGPSFPEGLALADLNGDGKLDVISADPVDHKIWLLINSPTYEGIFSGDGSGLTSLTASNITGILPGSALAGTYSNVVTFNNAQGNFSGSFSGNGSGLLSLNASQLTSGTVPDGALAAEYTQGVFFNNYGDIFTGAFIGYGSNLLNLNASQLTTGTVPGSALNGTDGSGLVNLGFSQFSGTLPGSELAGTYSNAVTFNHRSNSFTGTFIGNGFSLTNLNASQLTQGILPSGPLFGTYSGPLTFNNPANSFTGNGSGLNSLSASQLTTGTVPGAALAGTYSSALTLNNAANSFTGTFTGNGSGLTSLNASQLTSGPVPDSVLSGNVALRNGGNTFTNDQSITNGSLYSYGTVSAVVIRPANTNYAAVTEYDGTNNTSGFRAFVGADGIGITGTTGQMYIGTFSSHRVTFYSGDQPRMTIDTNGNVGIGTTTPTNKLHVTGGATFSSGLAGANQNVVWVPGSASWSFTSDRNTKEHVTPVNPQSVLDRLTRLPINEWSYIGYDQRHIGPMAQDFHAQFPFNESDTSLNDADLHGVALAAIQGLNEKVEKRSENAEGRIQKLEAENAELRARLERIERLVDSGKENSK